MMETETERKIEDTLIEILKTADMDEMTEFKVRDMAAKKLGIDLSGSERKRFVRRIVETFLLAKGEEEAETQEVEEERTIPTVSAKELDDDGDLIICRLSNKRRVTIQDFRGRTLISMREYYERDGKQFPSSRGISLTTEQWTVFRNNVPAIEEAIRQMEARLR